MALMQIKKSSPDVLPPSPALDRFSTSLLDSPLFAVAQDSLINFKVIGHSEGTVFISLALPDPLLKGFVRMLESLGDLFRFMHLKGRHVRAQSKIFDLEEIKRRDDYKKEYEKKTLQIFDSFKLAGLPDRQALSATNREMKLQGIIATYYQVEMVLRRHGKLSRKSSNIK